MAPERSELSSQGAPQGDFPQFAPLATGAPSKNNAARSFGAYLRGSIFSELCNSVLLREYSDGLKWVKYPKLKIKGVIDQAADAKQYGHEFDAGDYGTGPSAVWCTLEKRV